MEFDEPKGPIINPPVKKKIDRRGSKKGECGQPPHIKTDENVKIVTTLASYGVAHEDIAKQLDISTMTLSRHYRRELDTAAVEANARVADRLMKKCIDGDTTSMIFWLKTRAKWSYDQNVNLNGTLNLRKILDDLEDDDCDFDKIES